eukprot:4862325-Heterocapsa_arctica.AAC.1
MKGPKLHDAVTIASCNVTSLVHSQAGVGRFSGAGIKVGCDTIGQSKGHPRYLLVRGDPGQGQAERL